MCVRAPRLTGNQLASLPAADIGQLSGLSNVWLDNDQLASLPAEIILVL